MQEKYCVFELQVQYLNGSTFHTLGRLLNSFDTLAEAEDYAQRVITDLQRTVLKIYGPRNSFPT